VPNFIAISLRGAFPQICEILRRATDINTAIGTLAVDGSCYIWYSDEGPGRAGAPPSPLLAVPNVTGHPSTASVPKPYYFMWQYNCLWTLEGKMRCHDVGGVCCDAVSRSRDCHWLTSCRLSFCECSVYPTPVAFRVSLSFVSLISKTFPLSKAAFVRAGTRITQFIHRLTRDKFVSLDYYDWAAFRLNRTSL